MEFKLFQGSTVTNAEDYTETDQTNDDGVYFKHLLFDGISTMNYSTARTDTYTLWVSFPARYSETAEGYAGVIELVDIEIRAEQVVS